MLVDVADLLGRGCAWAGLFYTIRHCWAFSDCSTSVVCTANEDIPTLKRKQTLHFLFSFGVSFTTSFPNTAQATGAPDSLNILYRGQSSPSWFSLMWSHLSRVQNRQPRLEHGDVLTPKEVMFPMLSRSRVADRYLCSLNKHNKLKRFFKRTMNLNTAFFFWFNSVQSKEKKTDLTLNFFKKKGGQAGEPYELRRKMARTRGHLQMKMVLPNNPHEGRLWAFWWSTS